MTASRGDPTEELSNHAILELIGSTAGRSQHSCRMVAVERGGAVDEFPTIIAFSWGEAYRDNALRLQKQCAELGYASRIHVDVDMEEHLNRRIGDFPPRVWACRFIPTFIKRELIECRRSVLYLHADFQILSRIPPEAFAGLDVGLQERWDHVPDSPLRTQAAPVFVRDSSAGMRFLRLWEANCLNVDDGKFEHGHQFRTFQLMRELDRTARLGYFEPAIAGLSRRTHTVPITGHRP